LSLINHTRRREAPHDVSLDFRIRRATIEETARALRMLANRLELEADENKLTFSLRRIYTGPNETGHEIGHYRFDRKEPPRFEVNFYDADSWEGCVLPGWYWEHICPGDDMGDSVGPFETRDEAYADLFRTIRTKGVTL
jgi:hypothetical protein